MTEDFYSGIYNPDVLSCIANLSSDEVFTPPEVANAMLDMLPQELFSDPNTKFLDPACKSGVFLREIAKRLLKGLEPVIPDLQERIDHIFHNQLYGIAITEMTSLLSRRGVYCSKYPNSKYSVSTFDNAEGNIRYKHIKHRWKDGRCVFCGAAQSGYDRDESLESHAYEFIHTTRSEEIFKMKFDVIIGNPPYQMQVNEAGQGLGAVPLYQKFVERAIKLNPKYLSMIIPSRWFSGGVGLDDFRKNMLADKRLKTIVDYTDSKDCFPGVDVNGGICYFLWDSSYKGNCNFTNISNGKESSQERNLNEFPIFIRRNEAISIIHKVCKISCRTLSEEGGCSAQTPYGLLSTYTGTKQKTNESDCAVLSSKGWCFAPKKDITKGTDSIYKCKAMISKLSCEHAGNPDKNGMYRVLSRMEILKPNEICTQSYLVVCPSDSEEEAKNVYTYLRTKFVRFLILQTLAGMNISIANFRFVPWEDFSKPWTDEELYAKYGLTEDEIAFIESMIKPMDLGGEE